MVRLKGEHSLDDVSGKLAGDFNADLLAQLQRQFVSAGPSAEKALADFQAAAAARQGHENEFNQRARPAAKALDLKHNLRSGPQMQALRAFNLAKTALIEVNPVLGLQIATMVDKDLSAPTAQASVSLNTAAPRIR
jgi:hypothetical protein